MPHFERLSNEIILLILESCPDFKSLECLAFTCKRTYCLFDTARNTVGKNVLTNCIGPGLLPEACWVWLCDPVHYPAEYVPDLRFEPYDEAHYQLCRTFARNFLATPIPGPKALQIGYEDAKDLASFHQNILGDLFERFIIHCRKMNDGPLTQSLDNTPVTMPEKDRILRAFYRWELFCKLYSGRRGDVNLNTEEGLVELYHGPFFQRLAPWEIVQISCIHDFLGREIALCWRQSQLLRHSSSPLFVELVRDRHVPYSHVQGYLSMGLTWVSTLLNIPTPSEQRRIAHFGPPLHALHTSFWFSVMSNGTFSITHPFTDKLLDNNAGFNDGDYGPETLWDYRDHPPAVEYPLYDDYDWAHRGWGYMFWGRQRIDELNVLVHPWCVRDVPRRPPAAAVAEEPEADEDDDDVFGGWDGSFPDEDLWQFQD